MACCSEIFCDLQSKRIGEIPAVGCCLFVLLASCFTGCFAGRIPPVMPVAPSDPALSLLDSYGPSVFLRADSEIRDDCACRTLEIVFDEMQVRSIRTRDARIDGGSGIVLVTEPGDWKSAFESIHRICMTADFDCIPRSTADFHGPPRLVEHRVSALLARGDRCRPGTKFYFLSTLCGYDLGGFVKLGLMFVHSLSSVPEFVYVDANEDVELRWVLALFRLARRAGFPPNRIFLGGDDLCPCCYRTPQLVGADANPVWFDDDRGRHIPAVRMAIKAEPTTMFHSVFSILKDSVSSCGIRFVDIDDGGPEPVRMTFPGHPVDWREWPYLPLSCGHIDSEQTD